MLRRHTHGKRQDKGEIGSRASWQRNWYLLKGTWLQLASIVDSKVYIYRLLTYMNRGRIHPQVMGFGEEGGNNGLLFAWSTFGCNGLLHQLRFFKAWEAVPCKSNCSTLPNLYFTPATDCWNTRTVGRPGSYSGRRVDYVSCTHTHTPVRRARQNPFSAPPPTTPPCCPPRDR